MASMGSVDYRGLKEFQKELEKLQGNADAFLDGCVKELAARLLRLVIKRTPVGQYPEGSGKRGGTLRRGWTAQKGSSARSYAESLTVHHYGDNYVIEIVNPVEYASYVEYGHMTVNHKGWVPGRFMMTISEKNLEGMAPQILEKRIRKFMEGAFK